MARGAASSGPGRRRRLETKRDDGALRSALLLWAVCVALTRPASAGQCALPRFSVCVAVPQPVPGQFNATGGCIELIQAMRNEGIDWPLPMFAPTHCGTNLPNSSASVFEEVPPLTDTPDPMYHLCVSLGGKRVYTRMVLALCAASAPVPKASFVAALTNMTRSGPQYLQTHAAVQMWSYFSCHLGPAMPYLAVEGIWQNQVYMAGPTLSPPPPAGLDRSALIITGHSPSWGSILMRRSLAASETKANAFGSSQELADLHGLDATKQDAQPTMKDGGSGRKLQQVRQPPYEPDYPSYPFYPSYPTYPSYPSEPTYPSIPSPPSPPATPPSPASGTQLDDAMQDQLTRVLNVPAQQITADADLPIDVAPFKLLIGPYLNPGFATKYLQGGFNSEVAARYRSFTQAGGVTLVLASLNYEKLQGSQSCSASMALLKSVLGEGRLAGCSCQAIPGGNQDAFAKVNYDTITETLSSEAGRRMLPEGLQVMQQARRLLGEDFHVSMSTIGGLPLICNGSTDGYALMSVLRKPMPKPLPFDMQYLRIPAGGTIPAGYRLANCSIVGLQQSSTYIFSMMQFLDVCNVDGGYVLGPRAGFDEQRSPLVVCGTQPPESRPLGFGCTLVVKVDYFADVRLRPPPPPPTSEGDYEGLTDGALFAARRLLRSSVDAGTTSTGSTLSSESASETTAPGVRELARASRRRLACASEFGPVRVSGNLALHRPAYLSAWVETSEDSCGGAAAAATDGDTGTDVAGGDACATTTGSVGGIVTPWLSVDLGTLHTVHKVVVHIADGARLSDVEVRVGANPVVTSSPVESLNPVCAVRPGQTATGVVEYTCDPPLLGRYASVQSRSYGALTVCELEVFGVLGTPPLPPAGAGGQPAGVGEDSDSHDDRHGGTGQASVNLAQGRPAYVSSWVGAGIGGGGPDAGKALRANDGVAGGDADAGECAHTADAPGTSQPWWSVDLGGVFTVGKVVLYNRGDARSVELSDVSVRVGYVPIASNGYPVTSATLSPHLSGNAVCKTTEPGVPMPPGRVELVCDAPVSGQYVSVQLLKDRATLVLCEVEVYAPPRAAPPPALAPPVPPMAPVVGPFAALPFGADTPAGYRWLTCGEAAEYQSRGVLDAVGGRECAVLGGVVSGSKALVNCDQAARDAARKQPCWMVTNLVTVPEFPVEDAALVMAWPEGRGWVIFVGAGIVPEPFVFFDPNTWADRDFWRLQLKAITRVSASTGSA